MEKLKATNNTLPKNLEQHNFYGQQWLKYIDIIEIKRKVKNSNMKDLIDFYEAEKDRIQKEINDLWEVGKKSSKRTNRLIEIDYILDGLYANKEIKQLKEENNALKKRLAMEGIKI